MDLQEFIAKWYESKGYKAGPTTLALGAVEEIGELSEPILLTQCADFQCSNHKRKLIETDLVRINVAAEVGDVLIYLLALCNSLGIRPYLKCLSAEVKILVEATGVRA